MKGLITFFAGILSVIAVAVLLIAYGLLNARLATADGVMIQRPTYAADRFSMNPMDSQISAYGTRQLAYPVSSVGPVNGVAAVRAIDTYESPRTISRPVSYERSTRVERAPSRDWARTAMIIGGSTAAGAGLGGIFGGKRGALIGAALGGGSAAIFEVKKH